MALEGAIDARLEAFAGLTALIGTRSYAVVAPQNATRPFLVWQLISEPDRVRAMGSDPGIVTARVQFRAHSKRRQDGGSLAIARDVAEQVRLAFDRWRPGSPQDGTTIDDTFSGAARSTGFDPQAEDFLVNVDVMIHYRE